MSRKTPSISDLPGLTLLLCAVFVVYYVGLSGPFVFDDKPNLLDNPFIQLTSLDVESLRRAASSNQGSFFGRPIASLSFALNYYFAGGFSEFQFKLTNLIIHYLNGVLIFFLTRRIAARLCVDDGSPDRRSIINSLPIFITAFWLLHPIQLTSVLYVVQRMNSMAAFFVLSGLLVFLEGRTRLEEKRPGALSIMTLGIVSGTVIGVLCKENAALLPIYAGVLELSCFSRRNLDVSRRRRLKLFYWTVIGLPILSVCLFAATRPGFILEPYKSRTFTLYERVITQPRVLLYYVRLIFFPLRQDLGIFHDDFQVSSGLGSPPTTFFAIAGWVALVVAALYLRPRAPILFFAVSWFLAGHAMESSILGLEMVHEHRNYLPLLGPLIGFSCFVSIVFVKLKSSKRVIYGALGAIAITAGFVTHSRAQTWSSNELLITTSIKHHPLSPRAMGYYAELVLVTRNDLAESFHLQQKYSRHVPTSINGLIQMLRILKFVEGSIPADVKQTAVGPTHSSLFFAPLPRTHEEIKILNELIENEIKVRLETKQITPSTMSTLQTMSGCVFSLDPTCVALAPNLAKWIDVALANPRIVRGHRLRLFLTGSNIQRWLGNLEKAVIYAKFAARARAERVHALIQLGELYYALGDYELSRANVERLKKMKRLPRLEAEAVESLNMRLREKETFRN